jgi:ABC-2 type transport system permease protein
MQVRAHKLLRILPSLRYARTVSRLTAYETTFNTAQVVSDNVILLARLGTLILLYTYAASRTGGFIGGVSVEVVAWTSLFYFIVFAFSTRWTARLCASDVQSGKIEMYIARPVSYIWYRLFSKLGGMFVPVMGTAVGGSLLVCIIFGVPYFLFDTLHVLTLAYLLVCGFALGFCVNMCIGLCVFWLGDIQPVQNFYEKAAMVLGGAYVPVALFPVWLQSVATYTPFGLAYAATRVVSPNWANEWQTVLLAQSVWAVVFFFLMLYMYRHALGRLTVNGG